MGSTSSTNESKGVETGSLKREQVEYVQGRLNSTLRAQGVQNEKHKKAHSSHLHATTSQIASSFFPLHPTTPSLRETASNTFLPHLLNEVRLRKGSSKKGLSGGGAPALSLPASRLTRRLSSDPTNHTSSSSGRCASEVSLGVEWTYLELYQSISLAAFDAASLRRVVISASCASSTKSASKSLDTDLPDHVCKVDLLGGDGWAVAHNQALVSYAPSPRYLSGSPLQRIMAFAYIEGLFVSMAMKGKSSAPQSTHSAQSPQRGDSGVRHMAGQFGQSHWVQSEWTKVCCLLEKAPPSFSRFGDLFDYESITEWIRINQPLFIDTLTKAMDYHFLKEEAQPLVTATAMELKSDTTPPESVSGGTEVEGGDESDAPPPLPPHIPAIVGWTQDRSKLLGPETIFALRQASVQLNVKAQPWRLLYASWAQGRSFNSLLSRLLRFNCHALIVASVKPIGSPESPELTPRDDRDATAICSQAAIKEREASGASECILGALVHGEWNENAGKYFGANDGFLFTASPSFNVYRYVCEFAGMSLSLQVCA
eukprot:GHVN01052985.1.p1 GENE.GHVN01052985.1~~GHVN01052985.1.p1  ORF type:complete len:541 (+),score=111.79 GHVN01052985.1:81-1703(+)